MMSEISIIMPVYNEEININSCVKSILNQSMCNFELIIINDGSTDNTQKIIDAYMYDNRIRVINNGKIGKNAAFNEGYRLSKSNYIVFFAGDDVMPRDSLETRLKYINSYNNSLCIAGYGQLKMISNDKKYDSIVVPKNKTKGICTGTTIILSRALADIVFPIPENYPNEDIWTKLIIDYFAEKIINIPHIVALYRIHEGNSLQRTKEYLIISKNLHNRYLIYNEFYLRYNEYLKSDDLNYIKSVVKAEELRYTNKLFKIIFIKNIGFKEKLRFIFHSNKYLYYIRYSLYKYFTGWC